LQTLRRRPKNFKMASRLVGVVLVSTRRVGAAAIFAAVYAVLNLIPVSPLIGPSGRFLFLGNIFSPLAGMILGPLTGGFAMLVGTFLSVALGKPLSFDGLDFIPAVVSAVTAGFAMSGRVRWSVTLSFGLFAIFSADPLSPKFIEVGSVPVPYLWMHLLSVAVILVVVTIGTRRASFPKGIFIAATVFLSTMNAHVAGGIMYENVLVRINGTVSPSAIAGFWNVIFFVYPLERAFFTVAGSILAIAVMRALPKQTIQTLAGESSATDSH
jgi:hypothetical protein